MRTFTLIVTALVVACGPAHHGHNNDGNGSNVQPPDACVGLECQVVHCETMNMPPTTIKGTVYAPNGTLPLFGINVYVPNTDPGPMPSGLLCSQCTDALPGSPVGKPVQTGDDGTFMLTDMPSGSNIPLVITSGKWRRIINIASVTQCGTTTVGNADTTLPKAHDDLTANTMVPASWTASPVDMPKIAVTTGGCDQLECLVRKLGVADKEITNNSNASAHVHLYQGTGGVSMFDANFGNGQGGQSLASATPFWGGNLPGTPATLSNYDITVLSCECGQQANTKPQAALDAMKKYADSCGRVFASHWHNIWIGGDFQGGGNGQTPAVWNTIATWTANDQSPGTVDIIDETNNPKGPDFATWMLDVGGSTVRDQIQLVSGTERSTCTAVDNTKAERWTYAQSNMHPQNFQFTTPNELPPDMRGGKVVYTDMHVSGGPQGSSYPSSCGTTNTLTPQEKALAFMFFDIASCVMTNIP